MSPKSSRIRNVFEPLQQCAVTELWHSRFGISEHVFANFKFFKKGPSVWAINDFDLPRLSYESLGMRIMNLKDKPWKPTTCALRIFGRYAERNVIHLEKDEAMIFLEGGSLTILIDGETQLKSNIKSNLEPGYVVVFYRGEVLGCGLYSRGKLASQIPKDLRIAGSCRCPIEE